MSKPADSATKKGGERIQGLDVLRGIAILLVMLRHAFPNVFGGGGIVGVVVFFTLSGYLITGILMKDIVRYNRIRYSRFYRNRALRLVPALLFMVAGNILFTLVADPLQDSEKLFTTIGIALTYTGNVPFFQGSETIDHLLTLATEEQFYLIWPLLLLFLTRIKALRLGIILTGATIYLLCILCLFKVAPEFEIIYKLPFSWAVAMIIGAAACLNNLGILAKFQNTFTTGFLLPILILVAIIFFPNLKGSLYAYTIAGPAVAVVTVFLINFLRTLVILPYSVFKPLLWLGYLSYAAYLWNYPVTLWLNSYKCPLTGFLSVVLTIVLSAISYFLVEKPALSLKRNLDFQNRIPSKAS